MSSTPSQTSVTAEERPTAASTEGSGPGWPLVLLVFVAGAASLGVELSASRLLAPYFGTSLFVWANLIGLILLYLTIGYALGGRIADRYPRAGVLYALTMAAALLIAWIPAISRPILHWSLSAFATYSVGVFYGSLMAVILLFALPMMLLGCVSPFAVRLRVRQVGSSGRVAGRLYALSTAGSMLGTFVPVLWLIPTIGTFRTFLAMGVTLFLVSLLGVLAPRMLGRRPAPASTEAGGTSPAPASTEAGGTSPAPASESLALQPPHTGTEAGGTSSRSSGKKVDVSLLSLLLLVPLLVSVLGLRGPIKPPSGSDGGGVLVAERESAYNYIQVVRVNDEMQLILNEGVGIHSIYNPNSILTEGPWDYFMVAPYFNALTFTEQQVRRVCVIGLGAGTIPREMTAAYGAIPIDGVEIDGEIVNLARQYFAMNEPNLNVVVQDGRYFLETTSQHYDVIGIDAYQQPYVPFQLATLEFFQEVRAHLTPTGVAVINAGRTGTDFRLVEALAQTMRGAFSHVYIIDTERFANSLVIGTNAESALDNFRINTSTLSNPLLQQVAEASLNTGNIREEQTTKVAFTDDLAPVEQLIDQIIFDAVRSSGK